jgi:hypothetical protein
MLGLHQPFHRRGGTPFGGADVDYLTIVSGDREPKLCVWLVKGYLSGDVCDDRAVPGQFSGSLG